MDRDYNQLVECKSKWVETTLRSGKLKICRDMFIVDSKGSYELGVVKNGGMKLRRPLTSTQKNDMVEYYDLEEVDSDLFRNCSTYRSPQSNNLVQWLMGEVRKTD